MGHDAFTKYKEEVIKFLDFLKEQGKLNDCVFLSYTADEDTGWTYAHSIACYYTFPPDFNLWGCRDFGGTPVAHIAAIEGNLPKGFNKWGIKDENGETVAEVYNYYRNLKKESEL